MKKLLTLPALLAAFGATAQTDTLLFSDFNTDPSTYMQIGVQPPGNSNDTSWYSYDLDLLPDGSSAGTRPGEWFWTLAFDDGDTITQYGVMGSNSWTNDGSTPVANYLITPAIQLVDNLGVLSWKSAPFQTPRYLDGYKIVISTTTNDVSAFTDTIFVASEFVSLDNQSAVGNFASYTFLPGPTSNPMAPFIHGADGTYTTIDPADSSRQRGVLRPFSTSLAAYAGQTIYITFLHNDIDDNLISVDDILVMGTAPNAISEISNLFTFDVYPNPANELVNVKFDLPVSSDVVLNIYDVAGKLVRSQNFGQQPAGLQTQSVSLADLSNGVYQATLQTSAGTVNTRIVKN